MLSPRTPRGLMQPVAKRFIPQSFALLSGLVALFLWLLRRGRASMPVRVLLATFVRRLSSRESPKVSTRTPMTLARSRLPLAHASGPSDSAGAQIQSSSISPRASPSPSENSEYWDDRNADFCDEVVCDEKFWEADLPPEFSATAQVAKRLTDLLLEFPEAAINGVDWDVLVHSYSLCYEADLGTLEPTTLCWEGVRVALGALGEFRIAAEDALVMEPRPASLGHWPALYAGACNAVLAVGEELELGYRCLPLQRLKAVLQERWHSGFGDYKLGFLSAVDGSCIRVESLLDLVLALIEWRESRIEWQQENNAPFSAVDEALLPQLSLVDIDADQVLCCRTWRTSAQWRSSSRTSIEAELTSDDVPRPLVDPP